MGRAVPTVAEFAPSLAGSSSKFPGGETEALRRLKAHLALENGKWAAAFEKPQTSPTELDPFGPDTRSTTVLSPYLKFGCLSSRTFLLELRAATAAASTKSKPPMSLEGQILWREFYYACAKAVGPNFGQMKGNKICRQIAWRDVKTEPAAAEALKAWREGRTGYPWIDACMRQLASEGWIHHLARHAVACFLTRGDLWISWEEGAAVFDELLIDGGKCKSI
ncbi:DNA photolyase, FAD-binding/Cryptochrome [Pavlovales sp. CCMP2436]|nr:DNA photolyase, FAD-binding/Cryptochrome [Pavlovales sp. CCMP2436]